MYNVAFYCKCLIFSRFYIYFYLSGLILVKRYDKTTLKY